MTKKHRPLAARSAAALSALILSLSGVLAPAPAQASGGTPPPDPALKQTVTEDEQVAQGPAEITRGHVDVAPASSTASSSCWPATTPPIRRCGAAPTTR